jgi:hypothetical protein
MSRITALIICVVAIAGSAIASDDETAIRGVLHADFDRADIRLVIDPVVVVGNHAIADWTQGETGGRALLRRARGWTVILCSGDEIKTAEALQRTGMQAGEAATLAARLLDAESAIPAERRATLSTFQGDRTDGRRRSRPPSRRRVTI